METIQEYPPESSQPTYEELKPDGPGSRGYKYLGSQPTYEELKHVLYLQLRPLLIGSQPTYEELKPYYGDHPRVPP